MEVQIMESEIRYWNERDILGEIIIIVEKFYKNE